MITILLVSAAALSLMACGGNQTDTTAEDVQQEAQEAVETTGQFLSQERQEYMTGIEQKMNHMETRIAELKEKAAQAGEAQKKEVLEDVQQLEVKYDAARESMNKLQSSSEEAWEEMKSGLEAAVDEVDDAYERAQSHFS